MRLISYSTLKALLLVCLHTNAFAKLLGTEFSQRETIYASCFAFLSTVRVQWKKVQDSFTPSKVGKFWGCDSLVQENKRFMKTDELQQVSGLLMMEVLSQMNPEHLQCLKASIPSRQEIFDDIASNRLLMMEHLYSLQGETELNETAFAEISAEAGYVLSKEALQGYTEASCFWPVYKELYNTPKMTDLLNSRANLKNYQGVDNLDWWDGVPDRFEFEQLLQRLLCFLTTKVQSAMKPDRSKMCNLWSYSELVTEFKQATGEKDKLFRHNCAAFLEESLPEELLAMLEDLYNNKQPALVEEWTKKWNQCVKRAFEVVDDITLVPDQLLFEECGINWGEEQENLCETQISVFVTIYNTLQYHYPEILESIRLARATFDPMITVVTTTEDGTTATTGRNRDRAP